jgi:hypothetical protein
MIMNTNLSFFEDFFDRLKESFIFEIPFGKIFRFIYGLVYFIAGLNQFFGIFKIAHPEHTNLFWLGLESSGFILPSIALIQIYCGYSFIRGFGLRVSPFLLLPINFGIVMYHVCLDSTTLWAPIILLIINFYHLRKFGFLNINSWVN